MGGEILVIFLLIILNGIFSMSEIAVISSRKSRLDAAAKRGDHQAQQVLALTQSPDRFLSTVQVGITLIGILTGVFSGENITTDIQGFLANIEPLAPYSRSLAVLIVVVLITYFSLVIGELVPKRIGLSNPEGIARAVVGPMQVLSVAATPFIWLLTRSSGLIVKLFRLPVNLNAVTEDEIKAMIEEGTSSGAIQEIEQEIVENVLHLGDRRVASLMTSRQDIIWMDINDPPEENRRKILENRHSVYPLCDDQIDNVLGFVYLKDLLAEEELLPRLSKLDTIKRSALFLPENSKAYNALERFKETKIHHGIVVDEYGAVLGIVTINDIFDALVGDISQENEFEYEITVREDNSYLMDGQLPFDDFLQYLEITDATPEDHQDFHTLGGFAIHTLKRIPKTGDKFTWNGYEIEIVDMDLSRIDKVLVKKVE
ncbi:MAG: hemolysin family protein [Bacteroidia bacterium]|nr:hemolysin family protein [Bacteroidia bacterium]